LHFIIAPISNINIRVALPPETDFNKKKKSANLANLLAKYSKRRLRNILQLILNRFTYKYLK
jgi:hypothetical protein